MTKMNPMRNALTLILALSIHAADGAAAEAGQPSLSDQLSHLGSSAKIAAEPKETYYVVQDRHTGLAGVWELGLGAAKNVNSNIYINSRESSANLSYHFSNRFFSSLYGSQVYNELTESGAKIWLDDGIYPDTAFIKRRADLTFGFNMIYGKARVTQDMLFYFDQYLALGGGFVDQSNGLETVRTPAAVADVGVALWMGRRISAKVGVKDHYIEERRFTRSERVHQMLGYASLGMLLGGAG